MCRIVMAIVIAAFAGAAPPACAQSGDAVKPGSERFSLALGAFLNSFTTSLRVDNPTLGQGTNVNLRDDFGVAREQSSFWGALEWRVAPRHRLGFSYSRFKLNGVAVARRDIQFGDEIYPAGATITSEFEVEIIPVTYSYSFSRSDRHEAAVTVGVHWSRMSVDVGGTASVGLLDASASASAAADVPLPVLGLRYDHHFPGSWSAGAEGGYFAVKAGRTDGELWTARAYAEYRFTPRLGAGAAIDAFALNADSTDDGWRGRIEYRYWGPQLYLKARF